MNAFTIKQYADRLHDIRGREFLATGEPANTTFRFNRYFNLYDSNVQRDADELLGVINRAVMTYYNEEIAALEQKIREEAAK